MGEDHKEGFGAGIAGVDVFGVEVQAPLSDVHWRVAARQIRDQPLRIQRAASEPERHAIAAALDLLSLDGFEVDCQIRALGRDRFKAEGHWRARYRQTCVVTLEPIEVSARAPIGVEYWPAEQVLDYVAPDDPLGEEAPESLVEGGMDIGGLAYELFAVTIDPYPRKRDAELDRTRAGEEGPEAHPFAALSRLRGSPGGKAES